MEWLSKLQECSQRLNGMAMSMWFGGEYSGYADLKEEIYALLSEDYPNIYDRTFAFERAFTEFERAEKETDRPNKQRLIRESIRLSNLAVSASFSK